MNGRRGTMPDAGILKISWRTIAYSSLLLNLAAVATVATVAAIRDVDSLSTVALALAVLAFITQLIIYTVQTWQGADQLDQAKTLNTQTLRVLADVRARIEGTHRMVSDHQSELMRMLGSKSHVDAPPEPNKLPTLNLDEEPHRPFPTSRPPAD